MAREAYKEELNLYMLAQVASQVEKSVEKEQYSEYMCSECGDIYTQAGYKIIPVPFTGASPVIFKKEHPVVTQELAGSSRISEEKIEPPRPTQVIDEQKPEEEIEPPRPTQVIDEQKPEEEIEPPRPTQVIDEQKPESKSFTTVHIQTEPPCVSNAHAQTSSFQELSNTWKAE